MSHYDLTFDFSCQFYRSWPKISIIVDDQNIRNHQFSKENEKLSLKFPEGSGNRKLSIHRYGKTDLDMLVDRNGTIIKDQILEIKSIKINGTGIPDYIFQHHSRFEFEDQKHSGSMYFGPNGVWTFEFCEPLITWILDEKINHEAKYNQDYIYAWAYKLGPHSVDKILDKIQRTNDKIQRLNLE